MEISLPRRLSQSLFVKASKFLSSKVIVPLDTLPLTGKEPKTALITVVLPLPDSPTIVMISPSFKSKVTSCTVGLSLPP